MNSVGFSKVVVDDVSNGKSPRLPREPARVCSGIRNRKAFDPCGRWRFVRRNCLIGSDYSFGDARSAMSQQETVSDQAGRQTLSYGWRVLSAAAWDVQFDSSTFIMPSTYRAKSGDRAPLTGALSTDIRFARRSGERRAIVIAVFAPLCRVSSNEPRPQQGHS